MVAWMTYGLIGALAGPAVIVLGGAAAWRQPLSWRGVVRGEWPAMLATSLSLGAVLVFVARRLPWESSAVSCLVVIGSLLSFIDWACHRLPHALVAALMSGGVIHCGLVAISQADGPGRLLRAGTAALLVFAIALTRWLASPEGWGGGDVTLSGTVALYLGWFSWLHVIAGLALALAMGVLAFAVVRARHSSVRGAVIPFGPALVFASVNVIVLL